MNDRAPALQTFIDAAEVAFKTFAKEPAAKQSVMASFAALETTAEPAGITGARRVACERYLDRATDPAQFEEPALKRLAEAFRALEPSIHWQGFGGTVTPGDTAFEDGHANARIMGPGGLEPRQDVWLGASLLAPGIRYPDHRHPPEEIYLVLSAGEFTHGGRPWFEPGVGGSFYNPPGILHGMRSGSTPLFAFWLLRANGKRIS
jgi:hypothetical protein